MEAKLEELLGPPGAAPALEPLRVSLLAEKDARAVLEWLIKPATGAALQALAAHEEITHAIVDDLPQTGVTRYVRGLLVDVGALSERNEPLERTAMWLAGRFGDVPRHHLLVVRPFAEWTLLRRARRRASAGKFTIGSARYLRQRVNVTVHFLSWLDDHGRELDSLRQEDLDLYLAGGSTRRYLIRDFMLWAARHGQVPTGITTPLRKQLRPTNAYNDDARWRHLKGLLEDVAVPLPARVAGAMVLLYGQHLSRVVMWKTERVRLDRVAGTVEVRFDRAWVTIHEPIGALVRDLAANPKAHSRTNRRGEWLFPGAVPGAHLDPEVLRRVLVDRGIHLRDARNAALAELATDMPAPVLATLLGMHINTSVAWVKSMQRDWTEFVAVNVKAKA